ncbi:MAG TPA: MFS transporter, partial [Balneolaceae bacterium]|nr:MFS transporter [Balneolaceae bacterium]
MSKKDPYAALRFREFDFFLWVRFALTFAWSMQFVVIEWEVYSLTKDPWSLGLIGLMEVIPAVSMALFAGHIVDQKEKKGLLLKCIGGFTVISLGLFLLTWPAVVSSWNKNSVLYGIYALVFLGGFVRAFIGPTMFSLLALTVPKRLYANATTWNSMTGQMATVIGPAIGGFAIHWMGVHWSMCLIFGISLFGLLGLTQLKRKPVHNPNIGEPVFKSLRKGLSFVFNTKIILGSITLDMVAVLFGGAVALLPIFA